MSRCATEVEQAAFREDEHAVSVRELPFVVLGLDVDVLDALDILQAGHVDLVIEVTDIADEGLVLHAGHMVGGNDVVVARRGDEDVREADDVVEGVDLVALHGGLERADRIDLGHDHAAALATEAFGRTLADITKAADYSDLAT